jgi:hypothetical protein
MLWWMVNMENRHFIMIPTFFRMQNIIDVEECWQVTNESWWPKVEEETSKDVISKNKSQEAELHTNQKGIVISESDSRQFLQAQFAKHWKQMTPLVRKVVGSWRNSILWQKLMFECSKSFVINRSQRNSGTAGRKKDLNHKCLPWDFFGIHG